MSNLLRYSYAQDSIDFAPDYRRMDADSMHYFGIDPEGDIAAINRNKKKIG